jgi:acyl-CoA reductase-like NAD-dependent aldehyde dehydrogenase
MTLMLNSGQNCNAPSRMLVPAGRLDEVEALAVAALARVRVGDPLDAATTMGPLANGPSSSGCSASSRPASPKAQAGGGRAGAAEGIARGFFARPTIFSQVKNSMTIAREEIFGPVLSILPYRDEDDAVAIANDSPYGLSGYVSSADPARARAVARRLRTGNVHINGAPIDMAAPFGGYKQSGLGREWGAWGIDEFLEVKAMLGYGEGD